MGVVSRLGRGCVEEGSGGVAEQAVGAGVRVVRGDQGDELADRSDGVEVAGDAQRPAGVAGVHGRRHRAERGGCDPEQRQ